MIAAEARRWRGARSSSHRGPVVDAELTTPRIARVLAVKTTRLYNGTMTTLVNVRLDGEDARRVKALRDAGVPLSTLVRDAIRSEYARRLGAGSKRKPSAILGEILAALPDEPDMPRPSVDARDRRAVRAHVKAKLRRK